MKRKQSSLLFTNVNYVSARRRFPPSYILATHPQKGLCPLLREYLTDEHIEEHSESSRPELLEKEETVNSSLPAIDDTRRSTLSKGQHLKYMQLSRANRRNPSTRKEYQKLSQLVASEQTTYAEALLQFWRSQSGRLRIGFRNDDDDPASAYVQSIWNIRDCTWKYGHKHSTGACVQQISLLVDNPHESFAPDTIDSQVVYRCDAQKNFIPRQGDPLPPPASSIPIKLLQDDDLAHELALQHKVHVVTSLETLLHLLNQSSSWKIPVSRKSHYTLLDLPLPQPFNSTRECLAQGIQWALEPPNTNHYSYVILVLPLYRQKKSRVLVRLPSLSSIVTGVEYFVERGREKPTAADRAIWMLRALLLPDTPVLATTVDVVAMKIIDVHQVGIAHALTSQADCDIEAQYLGGDPLVLWKRLVHLIHAWQTIPQGSFLACLEDDIVKILLIGDNDGTFGQTVQQVNQVMSTDCFRPWKWPYPERVQWTFPWNGTQNPQRC